MELTYERFSNNPIEVAKEFFSYISKSNCSCFNENIYKNLKLAKHVSSGDLCSKDEYHRILKICNLTHLSMMLRYLESLDNEIHSIIGLTYFVEDLHEICDKIGDDRILKRCGNTNLFEGSYSSADTYLLLYHIKKVVDEWKVIKRTKSAKK